MKIPEVEAMKLLVLRRCRGLGVIYVMVTAAANVERDTEYSVNAQEYRFQRRSYRLPTGIAPLDGSHEDHHL